MLTTLAIFLLSLYVGTVIYFFVQSIREIKHRPTELTEIIVSNGKLGYLVLLFVCLMWPLYVLKKYTK